MKSRQHIEIRMGATAEECLAEAHVSKLCFSPGNAIADARQEESKDRVVRIFEVSEKIYTPKEYRSLHLKDLRARSERAEKLLKALLKPGDRVRVTKCPGTKRTITFLEWDGHWIVSKSGICDYSPLCVDLVNGKPITIPEP